MLKNLHAAVAFVGSMLVAGAASAACDPGKAGDELSGAEAQAVYDCLAADLLAGYQKGDKKWIPIEYVANYRNWTKASTVPAAPGFHQNRFLVTWVNTTGADEYLKYAENPTIPAGTLIAKESFSVGDNGKIKNGPLFFMEKTAAGVSPETDDWYYMAVAASGAPMGVNVITACSECHQGNFGNQGGLGYPVEEARVGQ